MSISLYLYFDGTCEAAFGFYKSIFGGEYAAMMRYADGPPEFQTQPSEKDKIMHMTLSFDDTVLNGADIATGFGEPPKPSNSFAISYAAKSREDADKVFAALKADGGAEAMAMQETFWGSYFGMCKDQFGVHWQVNLNLGQGPS